MKKAILILTSLLTANVMAEGLEATFKNDFDDLKYFLKQAEEDGSLEKQPLYVQDLLSGWNCDEMKFLPKHYNQLDVKSGTLDKAKEVTQAQLSKCGISLAEAEKAEFDKSLTEIEEENAKLKAQLAELQKQPQQTATQPVQQQAPVSVQSLHPKEWDRYKLQTTQPQSKSSNPNDLGVSFTGNDMLNSWKAIADGKFDQPKQASRNTTTFNPSSIYSNDHGWLTNPEVIKVYREQGLISEGRQDVMFDVSEYIDYDENTPVKFKGKLTTMGLAFLEAGPVLGEKLVQSPGAAYNYFVGEACNVAFPIVNEYYDIAMEDESLAFIRLNMMKVQKQMEKSCSNAANRVDSISEFKGQ